MLVKFKAAQFLLEVHIMPAPLPVNETSASRQKRHSQQSSQQEMSQQAIKHCEEPYVI